MSLAGSRVASEKVFEPYEPLIFYSWFQCFYTVFASDQMSFLGGLFIFILIIFFEYYYY